ncbi:MAG: hypothetical protein Q8R18_01770 [bacterium]|nr:hypothetical protein [bacterium]
MKRVVGYFILIVFFVGIFSVGINLYVIQQLSLPKIASTGQVTSTGTISITQAGSAGIGLSDAGIAFGSGYYNSSSCSLGYGIINSNTSRSCWANSTVYLNSEDMHVLSNSGTVPVNVTVSSVNLTDAEELFCGAALNCTNSSSAAVLVQSLNNESNSCSGLTTNFENITTASANASVGVCDILNYADTNDTIQIYIEIHIPNDASTGNKTLFMNYEAVAA